MPETALCLIPEWLTQSPAWGVSLQIYELRSSRNWGIGDFADLRAMCAIVAKAGGDFVGINPVHALFLVDAAHCSPYSPSNRQCLNPLYLAIDELPSYTPDAGELAEAEKLRAGELVDYEGVAALKLRALRRLYESWKMTPDAAFGDFKNANPVAARHALFEALSFHMVAEGTDKGWLGWPKAYQNPDGKAVQTFAQHHADDIQFHLWLQYLCDMQLTQTRNDARQSGLRLGLYIDLAVGEVPDGSATWSAREAFVSHATIGTPPDNFTEHGQSWGLTPLAPDVLMDTDGEAFTAAVTAAMRYGDVLRIDHALMLWRLYFLQGNAEKRSGEYMSYPTDVMIRALARASKEHGCVVIGEDLGDVPDGFREQMEEHNILSYRLLYFERKGTAFLPSNDYPPVALACLATHDLPTLKGWWDGNDIVLRNRLGMSERDTARQKRLRVRERKALLAALLAEDLLSQKDVDAVLQKRRHGPLPDAVLIAAHRFIARTPSMLAAARLADLTGEHKATNVPGFAEGYPNWRPKLAYTVEEIADSLLFGSITSALATERPRGKTATPAARRG